MLEMKFYFSQTTLPFCNLNKVGNFQHELNLDFWHYKKIVFFLNYMLKLGKFKKITWIWLN